MGYTYGGDATLGISFNVNTPKPLDIRAVVNSTKDLYEIPASNAYVGMTVANIADGNIYMLIDKANIDKKAGWKASYESIQIIACTAEQYKTWLDNTTIEGEVFLPKEDGDFIHSNTYYYVYEDSGIVDQDGNVIKDTQNYYVTKQYIEELLKPKANSGDLENLTKVVSQAKQDIQNIKNDLSENYYTQSAIADLYFNKEYITSTYYDIQQLYTKEEIDDKFVTKESLRGDSLEGEDDFVFVTQNQYSQDKSLIDDNIQTLQDEVNNSVKTNSDASLNKINVAESININGDKVITESQIAKHVTLTADEYEALPVKDPNSYYYIQQPDGDYGWVTLQYIKANYYSKQEVEDLIIKTIEQLNNSTES